MALTIEKNIEPEYGEDNYNHVIAGLIYITSSCPGPGVDLDLYCSVPKGCDCVGSCLKKYCPCLLRNENQELQNKLSETNNDFISTSSEALGPVTDCNDDCNCKASCLNRVVQNGPIRGLEIVQLGTKGFGVVSKREIPSGAFVCEYAGEIIGIKEALDRFKLLKASDNNYILILKEHFGTKATCITVIDPTIIGNIGRYMNHSCQPNLRIIPVRINSLVPVAALFALKNIQAGEEICYDYDSLSEYMDAIPFPINSHKSFSESDAPKPSIEITKIKSTSVDILSNFKNKAYSNKPCLCLSDKCNGFLPSNMDVFT